MATSSTRALPRSQTCPLCTKSFSAQGLARHIASCQKKQNSAAAQNEFRALASKLRDEERANRMVLLDAACMTEHHAALHDSPDTQTTSVENILDISPENIPDIPLDTFDNIADPPQRSSLLDSLDAMLQTGTDALEDQHDSENHIRIQFHPSSGRVPETISTAQYNPHHQLQSDLKLTDDKPWHPFRTRLDFEIAELALDTHMNAEQKKTLLSIIEKCINNPSEFTINSTSELEKTWELARGYRSTGFTKHEYLVPYRQEEVPYEVYVRPLISWCSELLGDPVVLPNFRWNAERHYRTNSFMSERLFGEPWTADTWWNIQSLLPKGAFPFFIILYADKTRLSTFGTAKAYPVLARCANLPATTRNGQGVGGGRLVGWLPIVEEDSGESGKKIFVNFKRIVWHKGFYEILKSIQAYATTGYHFKCADGILRWLFFFVLILSADYEEQCVISLTRGATSNFPCPICLVPREELSNLLKTYPLRTSQEMNNIYLNSQNLNAKDREEYLKDYGLRNVENVFWMMNGTDVYQALSWDRLHAYHGGLFSDHLWSEFKSVINILGRHEAELVDDQFNLIPRWSGLNHFSSVIKTGEFADGSKYEDMAKIIVFASHNVLQKSERGYCLLKLIKTFVELDMYSSLTVHSATTLHGLQNELRNFDCILKEYNEIHPEKNWNFPKNHSHVHMLRDIITKGATRNSNTKPNEKAHGLLKLWYRFHTNFKDVAPQILKMNEDDLISMIIRMGIDSMDDAAAAEDSEPLVNLQVENNQTRIFIGSLLKPVTFASIEQNHQSDPAFERFRIKTGKYLAAEYNKSVRLTKETMITPFQLLQIQYTSIADWTPQRDMLRVSPSFHKQPRNDYVLIWSFDGKHFFAQLMFMFSVQIADTEHELALVLPLDQPVDQRTTLARKRDKDLNFRRVQVRRRTKSVIVDVRSVVRGGLLVEDFGNDGNSFIVMDIVDPDMWWRLKLLSLNTQLNL